jgi:16S rRNA (guanine527-N7)-methyltransferase
MLTKTFFVHSVILTVFSKISELINKLFFLNTVLHTILPKFTYDNINYMNFEQYEQLLIQHNDEFGLLGPKELDKIYNRHIYNSLNLLPLIDKSTKTIVDIGSGAGLPGIPLAIALPDIRFILVEPKLKRVKFLELVKQELKLTNVEIVKKSIQEVKVKPDIITSRAVASLDKLLEISKHLWSKDTTALFLKGEKATEEIEEASDRLFKMRLGAKVEEEQFSKEFDKSIIIKICPKKL